MNIAIIGTGISGLVSAYLLSRSHDVQIYEKNRYIGGHSRTIEIKNADGAHMPVDTGFIVFNKRNYPKLVSLFDRLGVAYEKSDMSFAASIDDGRLEYSSRRMFGQRRNLVRPAFWTLLGEILSFNRRAPKYIEDSRVLSLEDCLREMGMSSAFRHSYLLVMGASIWSSSIDNIAAMPAQSFLRFCKNHGLLERKHLQWYTVTGGARRYIKALTDAFKDRIRLGCGAKTVAHETSGIRVYDTEGGATDFDRVVFACHADESLSLLARPTEEERAVLSAFRTQKNPLIVHGDDSFMPKRRRCWASWNYLGEKTEHGKAGVSLTYWMNNLQPFLGEEKNIFVTVNPQRRPRADLIMDEHVFSHPLLEAGTVQAQKRLARIQGGRGFWFCGAWQGYGFHEDGVESAVRTMQAMGEPCSWL